MDWEASRYGVAPGMVTVDVSDPDIDGIVLVKFLRRLADAIEGGRMS